MKLIYGRAGTGKTEYIFNDINDKINKEHIKNKIYIITPEQFSFTAEKKLLETLVEGAATNVEVFSFERMAYRVVKETANSKSKNLEKSLKSMIVFDAINRNQKNLKFLGKSQENAEIILTEITEFKKHNITPEMLEKQVNETTDEYLKSKLNDMLIMYKEFEKAIPESFIDENDLLTILAENIEKSQLFDNSYFYIDEFAGFTKQEYSVIKVLNKIAKEIYITVCVDSLYEDRVLKENDIFYDNKQTIKTLAEIDNGIKTLEENSIKLDKCYRFKNEELAHLEKNIFSMPYKVYDKETKNIKLYLAENQYEEIENVAKEIIKLVRDEGYSFSDIAIICNNIEGYSSLFKAIFSSYEIPVFIDENKDITQNIVIKYVLAILDIFAKSFSYESVFNYVKTGLTGINDVYELENYCLKWGIQGNKFYKEPWKYEKKKVKKDDNLEDEESSKTEDYEAKDDDLNFNKDQQILINNLVPLKNELSKDKTAKQMSKILYDYLVKNSDTILARNFGQTSTEKKANENGKNKNANFITNENDERANKTYEENLEALNLIIDILNEIAIGFGDKKMSFDEFSKILKVGLSSKELGQIPSFNNKVIVGDVNRSKTHKVRAMFIIGVNDGSFPSTITSEGFFNDKDRENLKEEGFELAKGTKEKLYEENFNIYKAFTTAEEKLFVSYSASDTDGKALRKSLMISKLKRIFKNLQESTFEDGDDSITFTKLLNNMENPEWKEVFIWYKKHYPEKLDEALQGLKYTNAPEKLEEEAVEKLYGNNFKTSISKLEKYMSCPFSYYLKYGLKLSEKEKLDIKPIDTGSFMHEIIDEFFKRTSANGIDIKEITEKQISDLVSDIINDESEKWGKFTLTAKYRMLVQRLKRVVTISLKYIVESLKESDFDVSGTEIKFDDTDDANYQPIEIELGDGKKVSIIGKIDRADIARLPDGKFIRIIDYKSSAKDLDLNKVVSGLQLQLITYVDAMCKTEKDLMPAGALYFTLLEPKITMSKREDLTDEKIAELIQENYKMNGIVLANVNVIKAMDKDIEQKSNKIPVTLNKSREINFSKSRTVTREEFEGLQKYVIKLIKQISKEIVSGNIELKPYYSEKNKNTPCQYCEYKTICQFNPKFKNNNYRYIPNEARQAILDRLH